MKKTLIISAGLLAVACASGPEERSPSAEQRERMQEQRAAAEAEPGSEPIPSQFDRDGDGEVENAELKKSGVSEGAIDRLDDDDDDDNDNDNDDDRASEHASDTEITERVREKIAAHDDLSTKAKNVRVSTDNGKVTLSGKVESAVEKSKVESCAREVAGADDVDNRIDVVR
jgi:hypothetical protein